MARDKALWDRIRADFLATGTSYPDLAKKYSVSLSTLKKKAAREAWVFDRNSMEAAAVSAAGTRKKRNRKKEPAQKKEEPQEPAAVPVSAELVVPTDTEIADMKKLRADKFFEATDAMMDRILSAITDPEVVSPYAIKQLASALRDIREMQGLNRTALDIEEQQARIAKLRSETRVPEDDGGNTLRIEFIDPYGE